MCSMPSCLRARPTWVRQVLSTGSPALGRVEVMAAAVGVEGREQSMRCDHLLEPHKARSRALLLDQDGREDRARGVVQGHDKIEFRPLRQPGVLRAVLE